MDGNPLTSKSNQDAEDRIGSILLRFHSNLPSEPELHEIDATLNKLGFHREMRLRTIDLLNRSKFIIDCSYASEKPASRKEVEREIRAMRMVYSLKALFVQPYNL